MPLVPTADLKSANLEAGRVGAHCEDGLLILHQGAKSNGSRIA